MNDPTSKPTQRKFWKNETRIMGILMAISFFGIVIIGYFFGDFTKEILVPTLSGTTALLIALLTFSLVRHSKRQAEASAEQVMKLEEQISTEKESIAIAQLELEQSREEFKNSVYESYKSRADARMSFVGLGEPSPGATRVSRSGKFQDLEESGVDEEKLGPKSLIQFSIKFPLKIHGNFPVRLYATLQPSLDLSFEERSRKEWWDVSLGEIKPESLSHERLIKRIVAPGEQIEFRWVTLFHAHQLEKKTFIGQHPDGQDVVLNIHATSLDGTVSDTYRYSVRAQIMNLRNPVPELFIQIHELGAMSRIYPAIQQSSLPAIEGNSEEYPQLQQEKEID